MIQRLPKEKTQTAPGRKKGGGILPRLLGLVLLWGLELPSPALAQQPASPSSVASVVCDAPLSQLEVEDTLRPIPARIVTFEQVQAREALETLLARIPCLAEPAPRLTLARIRYLYGMARLYELDDLRQLDATGVTEIIGHFQLALSLEASLSWDRPAFGTFGEDLFVEAARTVSEARAVVVLIPTDAPFPLWLDGKRVDAQKTIPPIQPGQHLIQTRYGQTVVGHWWYVGPEALAATLVVPPPPLGHEVPRRSEATYYPSRPGVVLRLESWDMPLTYSGLMLEARLPITRRLEAGLMGGLALGPLRHDHLVLPAISVVMRGSLDPHRRLLFGAGYSAYLSGPYALATLPDEAAQIAHGPLLELSAARPYGNGSLNIRLAAGLVTWPDVFYAPQVMMGIGYAYPRGGVR